MKILKWIKAIVKRKPLGPGWLRLLLFTGGAICMGTAIALMVLWINFDQSYPTLMKWINKYDEYFPFTAAIYTMAVFVLGVALNRLWAAGAIVAAAGMVLTLIDYFKLTINGTPLTLEDFGLATKLGEVAGVAGDLTPPYDFWRACIMLAVCVVLLFLFQRLTILTGERRRFLCGTLSLIALLWTFSPEGGMVLGPLANIDIYASMPPANNHRFHGLTLSLWRDAVMQGVPAPDGYSEAYMQDVLTRIDEILLSQEQPAAGEDSERVVPNVVYVLSESFFDITRLPELTYESDPLVNFHALESESISGTFHSHYLGYGTGYIEMTTQYGITKRDFGTSANTCFLEDEAYTRFRSMVNQIQATGDYVTEMFHAFDDSLYHRTTTYPLLGYSDTHFSADIQQMGIEWGGSVYGGYYLKDAYTYKGMVQRLNEINAAGKNALIYGITMENHQPFKPAKFEGKCQIGFSGGDFTAEEIEVIKVMVEGITRADQALGQLTEALRQVETPTILVYFGDHRPNLVLPNKDSIYTRLGQNSSADSTEWTVEECNEIYSTDYLIWANDPSLLKGMEGTRTDSSVTALSTDLLQLMDIPVTRYWGLMAAYGDEVLVNTDLYFVDRDGNVAASPEEADLSSEAQELIDLRRAVLYDAFYGKRYITEALNKLPGTR